MWWLTDFSYILWELKMNNFAATLHIQFLNIKQCDYTYYSLYLERNLSHTWISRIQQRWVKYVLHCSKQGIQEKYNNRVQWNSTTAVVRFFQLYQRWGMLNIYPCFKHFVFPVWSQWSEDSTTPKYKLYFVKTSHTGHSIFILNCNPYKIRQRTEEANRERVNLSPIGNCRLVWKKI